jgi:putative MATE family efflux protein
MNRPTRASDVLTAGTSETSPSPVVEIRTADRKAAARTEILTAPVFRTLMKLALPITVVLIAQTAVGVAETFYVGFLGTDALAGVALVFPLFMLMTTMSNGGIGSGVASAVARAVGADRQHDADALVLHAIVLAIVFGGMFTLGDLVFGRAIYRAMGGGDGALDAALKYSSYLFAGAVPVWIVNLLAAALRGSGNVRVPALVTLIGAMILIPASPALIFGFGPIPRLGIGGAGLAFGLYYGAASLVLIAYMVTGRSGLRLTWGPLRGRLLLDVLRVGIPVAVTTIQTNLSVIVVTGLFGLFGTNALAGYGSASRLDYVMIPLLFGFASAVLTMVGINVGAGAFARAKRIAWVGAMTGAAITGTIGVLVAIFPRQLWLHLFSDDLQVLAPAVTYLHIVAPFYGVFGLAFIIGFAAQGAGRAIWPFLLVSARMLVAVGIGWLAVVQFGAGMTVLSAIVAASFVAYAIISLMAMFSRSLWKNNQLATTAGSSESARMR